MDEVFKALADPTRRQLLDSLRQQDGQTLAQLCEHSAMSRQAVTKHLNILIAAQLVVAMREGRFKRHYINPVPIQEIAERWVDQFRALEVNTLLNLKRSLEEQP